MIKLFTLLLLLSCGKLSTPNILTKPIALVKYQDTIYHCEGVKPTACGYSIHCGNMSVHCADVIVEWL